MFARMDATLRVLRTWVISVFSVVTPESLALVQTKKTSLPCVCLCVNVCVCVCVCVCLAVCFSQTLRLPVIMSV